MTYANIERHLAFLEGVNPDTCKMIRLSERPTVWRHACFSTGVIAWSSAKRTQVIDEYRGEFAMVEYIVCPHCRKIIYYVED